MNLQQLQRFPADLMCICGSISYMPIAFTNLNAYVNKISVVGR